MIVTSIRRLFLLVSVAQSAVSSSAAHSGHSLHISGGVDSIPPLQKTAKYCGKSAQQRRSAILDTIVGHPRGGQEEQVKTGRIHLTTGAAVLFGALLAFNGGFVNGACLSGILSSSNTKQAASAVTGAYTNSALGLVGGNWDQFAFNAECILSYAAGSLIYGILCPEPVPFELNRRSTAPAFLIGAALLFASSNLASKGDGRSFILPALVASGLQNSITSSITSNLVRSAHFSGITSDIGTFLGQVLRGNKQNAQKLRVFCLLAASFWSGGVASFYVASELASRSLLFSATFYLVIGASLLELYFY